MQSDRLHHFHRLPVNHHRWERLQGYIHWPQHFALVGNNSLRKSSVLADLELFVTQLQLVVPAQSAICSASDSSAQELLAQAPHGETRAENSSTRFTDKERQHKSFEDDDKRRGPFAHFCFAARYCPLLLECCAHQEAELVGL